MTFKDLPEGTPLEVFDTNPKTGKQQWRRTVFEGESCGWVYVAPFAHFQPGVYRYEHVRLLGTTPCTTTS